MRGGTSSRDSRSPHWNIRGQVEARRPGRAHPKQNTEQGLSPPGRHHPGTSGGQTPRTASSGADQAAGAVAPQTGSSGDKGRPGAPDSNIRSGSGSRSHRTRDSIVEGHVAGRCPGQEQPGQNKKQRPQPRGQNCTGRNNQRWSHRQGRSVQGKVAARGEGNRTPRLRLCREGVKSGGNAKDNAGGMQ